MLRRNQKGFSLIEVLISVVVMAVGLLGIAGLQVASMQQNRSAIFRAEALALAQDMADRIRANPTWDYETALTDTPANSPPDCYNNLCTRSQMIDYDVAQWQCSINSTAADGSTYTGCGVLSIAGTLPNGAGSIAWDDGGVANPTMSVLRITVQWQQGLDATPNNVVFETQMTQREIKP